MKQRLKIKTDINKWLETHTIDTIYNIIKSTNLYTLILESTAYLPTNSKFIERLYHIMNDIFQVPKCEVCDNPAKFQRFSRGYNKCCSVACASMHPNKIIGIKSTPIEIKKESRLKTKRTKLKKYNNPNYTNIEKATQTNLKKYGVASPLQAEEIKEKIKQTCLKKYGVENPLLSDEIKIKIKNNRFQNTFKKFKESKRWGNEYTPMFNEQTYTGTEEPQEWKHDLCGNTFLDHLRDGKLPRCPYCYPVGTSKIEKELQEWLAKLIKIEKNKKFGWDYELDIFIPSKNVGIEFDGLYWHGEISGNKNNLYHLNKTKYFESKGIQLIHIFEDEWLDKEEIVKSILLAKLGLLDKTIYARKCVVQEAKPPEAKLFLFDNHIQGSINSKINLGLFYENELVSLMSFSKPRFNKKYDWEMVRFCNKVNTNVVGAGSKLLSYFKKHYQGSIISYADKRYSDGNFYEKLGFKKMGLSNPNYFYFFIRHKKIERFSRIQFQKHKLKNKLEIFDPKLTEWQNMQLNGYDRIWDCGNLIFVSK
jgi:hypothetical protein